MSKVKVVVEWIFNDVVNYFAFLDFKKNIKMGLSAISQMYFICPLIRSVHACLYRSTNSKFF